MNAHRSGLWHTALPDLGESRIQSSRRLRLIDLIDKCYICAIREDQPKLIISSSEDVKDRVVCPIKNLNILHLAFLFNRSSWPKSASHVVIKTDNNNALSQQLGPKALL